MARLNAALGRRYTVERELGRGGMGTVYLALDRKHARKVAIKILPSEIAQAVGTDRFLREIAISARLTHPHILSVHDSGQAAGLLYYVMPYIAGESLRERLDRGPALPVERVLRIGAELSDALAFAHEAGIVHRDVKPENIMLAGEHAVLADFGIARALGSDDELTDSGLAVGTRRYTSPEQAVGSRATDAGTDIYSLGCVLYEMLAGPDAAHALERRFVEPLPSITRERPDAPPWIDAVVARATAPERSDRFSTARELHDAIVGNERYARNHARLRRVSPRRVGLIAAAGAALGIGVVALAVRQPSAAPTLARDRVVVAGFENRTGDSSLAPLGDMATDYIARGLAATHLIQDVFDARALALETGHRPRAAGAGRQLATRLGAGTVVSGGYFLDGDALHFEAQLVDARTGRVVLALDPVVGDVKDKSALVELLRQRVMAGFAVTMSPTFDSWRAASIPPTYEAYQEMLAGDAATWVFDFPEALRHFRRAASLDTTFTSAQTSAVLQLWLLRDCKAVDSAARRLMPRRPTLPPLDRLQLEYATAACRQDTEGALAAATGILDVAPRSVGFAVLGAIQALAARRPATALDVLLRFDPAHADLTGEPLVVYRDWVAMAYHALGRHADELAIARTGLRAAPRAVHLLVDEASALAALGRGDEAERLASAWVKQRTPADVLQGEQAECVALELRAHGDAVRSRRLLERAASWYGDGGAPAAAIDDTLPCLWDRFSVHYYLDRWDDARAGYERRLARDSAGIKAHAALGAIAAHRHDRVLVERADDWLARRSDPLATVARARLAAIAGDRDRAVMLLRQAVRQGLNDRLYLLYIHLDPDFDAVRSTPEYRDLLRPKG